MPPPLSIETAAALFLGLLSAALMFDRMSRLWRRYRRGKWARAQADIDALRAMTPSEFEAFTAAAFEARGWRVEIVGRKAAQTADLTFSCSPEGGASSSNASDTPRRWAHLSSAKPWAL